MIREAHPDSDLPYLLYLPENLDAQETWPLIVFLHGSGEAGKDLALVRKWGVPKYLDAGNDIPAIVYVPQSRKFIWWNMVQNKVLTGIGVLRQEYNISKVHLTGFSMGGHGTCYIGVKHPERFDSFAPVAMGMRPFANFTNDICVLKDKPIWVFHSEGDRVSIKHSDKVVEKLRACDAGQLQYSRLIEASHTETADFAYLNEEFYEWIFSH